MIKAVAGNQLLTLSWFVRFACSVCLALLAGCSHTERARRQYVELSRAAAESYHGRDAQQAATDLHRLVQFMDGLDGEGIHLTDMQHLQAVDYARLGLLAEHLREPAEARRDFDRAVTLAQGVQMNVYAFGPFPHTEAGLRRLLAIIDPPTEAKWMAEPPP